VVNTEEKNYQLIEYLESLGYSAYPHNGYKVINRYTEFEREIDSLYNGVSLRNISHMGIIELKGKDSLDLLHRIATNSVKDLPKQGVRNTIFTSEKGRIIDLGTLLNFEDYQLLVSSPANKLKVMSWIRKYVISDDVAVNDANLKYNLLELSGPQANSFATLVGGNIINDIPVNSFRIMHLDNLLFFLFKISSERGFNKFWFLADFENTKKLINYMNEYKGPFNFSMVGEEAFNTYRIEQGIPAAPNELNDEYNPHEAGIIQYVDFKKGCYIGQEVIARLETYDKVQKRLTGVRFLEPVEIGVQYQLQDEKGNEIGKITSSTFSSRLKEYVGLAFIRNSHLVNSIILNANSTNGKSAKVEVHSLPFLK
jgi:folate-binding protein YgfZ